MSSLIEAPFILAQAAAPAPGPSGMFSSGGGMMLVYGLLFVAMYFLMIAPQRKKQKEQQKMLDALETGDEVVTAGGIFGEITNKKDDRFVIRISDNTKVEVGKSFVTALVKKAG